jgi:hypothetical protein
VVDPFLKTALLGDSSQRARFLLFGLRKGETCMKRKFWVLGEYLGHLFIGAVMFVALLAFGGALNMLVHWAAPIIGDPSFSELMMLVKKTILYIDILFIVWCALTSTFKAIKEMINDE